MFTLQNFALLDLLIALTVVLGLGYAHRFRLPRPPVGRSTASDVLIMSCLVVVMPITYLAMPAPAVSAVFGVMIFVSLQLALGPLVGGRPATAAAVLLVAATAGAAIAGYGTLVLVLNSALIMIVVIGVTTLWTQTGMTAGHVAAFAATLAVYDLFATGLGDMTDRFLAQVEGYPFAPLLAVTTGAVPVAAGLGDCLMLALWPMVATKAYGRTAGWVGAACGIGLIILVQVGFATGVLRSGMAFLTVLGPAILVQYLVWRGIHGAERRTSRWLGGPAPVVDTSGRVDRLSAALRTARTATDRPADTWVAVDDDAVIAQGPTPGTALRAARRAGYQGVPFIRQL
ncbi:hypothetical protein AB0I81_17210 [Nonomuraea sp. NPDC050404]|uniref:hypothetical protein n=1 Tax=Nonomuraea sp. NPDC050404 TaxID=3155783 RepID=UPI00340D3C94